MKGILIFLIVIIVIGGVSVYFISFSENEEDMRKNIENIYYDSQILGFKTNGYLDFDSREDAEGATRCISKEFSELVRKEDIKRISDKMKWSDRPTSTLQRYLKDELDYDSRGLERTMQYCLDKYNYNETI